MFNALNPTRDAIANPKILHNVAASSVFERALINESELVSGAGDIAYLLYVSTVFARMQFFLSRRRSRANVKISFDRATSSAMASSVRLQARDLKNAFERCMRVTS